MKDFGFYESSVLSFTLLKLVWGIIANQNIGDRCDYKSAQNPKVAIHKVIQHSSKKDFKCDICDYKGATSKYLRRHNEAAHESIPHRCQDGDYIRKTLQRLRYLKDYSWTNLSDVS